MEGWTQVAVKSKVEYSTWAINTAKFSSGLFRWTAMKTTGSRPNNAGDFQWNCAGMTTWATRRRPKRRVDSRCHKYTLRNANSLIRNRRVFSAWRFMCDHDLWSAEPNKHTLIVSRKPSAFDRIRVGLLWILGKWLVSNFMMGEIRFLIEYCI